MRVRSSVLSVRLLVLVALVASIASPATPVLGQGSGACLPDDAGAAESLAYLKKVVSSTVDERRILRDSLGIPAYPDSVVAVVLDSAICQQAVVAFERDVADSVQAGRRLYVFRVSDQLLVVEDPTERAGEWSILAFYTPAWVHRTNLLR